MKICMPERSLLGPTPRKGSLFAALIYVAVGVHLALRSAYTVHNLGAGEFGKGIKFVLMGAHGAIAVASVILVVAVLFGLRRLMKAWLIAALVHMLVHTIEYIFIGVLTVSNGDVQCIATDTVLYIIVMFLFLECVIEVNNYHELLKEGSARKEKREEDEDPQSSGTTANAV